MPVVTIPAAGQFGLVADQPAQELPPNAWTRIENTRFHGGKAERIGGRQAIFSAPAVTPYYLIPYEVDGYRYWIHCGTAAIYADDGTTRANITGIAPTGSPSDLWTGCVHGGVLCLTNKVDAPQYWGGTGALAALPAWPSNYRCGSIASFKSHLVAVDLVVDGSAWHHTVKWSVPCDPGTVPTSWDHTDDTLTAGEFPISETTDFIVDQLALGDANIIYKQRSMYAMRYIGGTQIFEFRRIPGNYGMLSRGCAASTPKGHLVLSAGDIVLHDGVNEPQSLINDKLREWLFSYELDSDNRALSFVVAHPHKSEVWVCYPEVGESTCTKALIWNWDGNTWGSCELPNVTYAASGMVNVTAADTFDSGSDLVTFDDDDLAFNQDEYPAQQPRLLMASTEPMIYMQDIGSLFGDAEIPWTLERIGLAFDDPSTLKTLKSLVPRFDGNEGDEVSITFGWSNDPEVGYSWGAPITYTVGSTRKADSFATGRFIGLRFEKADGSGISLKSFDLDLIKRGLF